MGTIARFPTSEVSTRIVRARDGGYEYELTDGRHYCLGWHAGTREQVLDYLEKFRHGYRQRQCMISGHVVIGA